MSSLLASIEKVYSSSLVINCDTATVTDISSYNHSITLNNGAAYDTTNKYLSFDGSDDYVSIASNASLGMGTSDFTAECWVYPEAFSTNGSDLSALIENRTSPSSGGFLLWIGADSTFVFYTSASDNTSQRVLTSLSSAVLNRWTHVAAVRENGALRLYINGVLHDTESYTLGYPEDLSPSGSSSILLGTACDAPGGSRNLQGKLDNIRIVKGVALYNKQFTPVPRTYNLFKNANKLPNTVNHLVLTTTKSSGSLSGTISTTSGYYTVHWWDGTKNTYSSGASFSKSAVGGTRIFYLYPSTSTGDIDGYLQSADVSNNSLTDIRAPYCIFLSAVGSAGTTGGGYQYYGYPYYYSRFVPGNPVFIPGSPQTLNVSNNSLSASALDQLYTDLLDGDGLINVTDNSGASSDSPSIATNKGYTIYGSIASYTLLLLNCNGSNNSTTFTDSSSSPKTITRTNTVISTTQSKFGGASAYFSNTGSDALEVTESFNLSDTDYTIEFWFYLINQNGSTNNPRLFSLEKSGQSWGVLLTQTTPNFASYNLYGTSTAIDLNNTSFNYNTWYHFAMTKEYNTYRLFLGGNLIGSDTGNYTPTGDIVLTIGGCRLQYTYNKLNAYIDDFRVIKGKALYTSNFTAPSSQLAVYP